MKEPAPLMSVEFTGSVAMTSVLVKCTVPLYPVTVAFPPSSAVTEKVKGEFAVAEVGALTAKCVAAVAVARTMTTPFIVVPPGKLWTEQ